MKQTIWKFELTEGGVNYLSMPVGAKILTVQHQFDGPKLWAIVDKIDDTEERRFIIYGTGGDLTPIDGHSKEYLGTYQSLGGHFVGHVFELIKLDQSELQNG